MKKQLYKVAVIEDDSSIQLMYALKLKHEGYSVKTASNGEEGLQIIESFQPHLILLDLRMPVMSGDEMLRVLRQKPWGKTLKVIVLTNLSRNEAHIRLAPLRVHQYIVKANHTPKQVIEIIQEVLAS